MYPRMNKYVTRAHARREVNAVNMKYIIICLVHVTFLVLVFTAGFVSAQGEPEPGCSATLSSDFTSLHIPVLSYQGNSYSVDFAIIGQDSDGQYGVDIANVQPTSQVCKIPAQVSLGNTIVLAIPSISFGSDYYSATLQYASGFLPSSTAAEDFGRHFDRAAIRAGTNVIWLKPIVVQVLGDIWQGWSACTQVTEDDFNGVEHVESVAIGTGTAVIFSRGASNSTSWNLTHGIFSYDSTITQTLAGQTVLTDKAQTGSLLTYEDNEAGFIGQFSIDMSGLSSPYPAVNYLLQSDWLPVEPCTVQEVVCPPGGGSCQTSSFPCSTRVKWIYTPPPLTSTAPPEAGESVPLIEGTNVTTSFPDANGTDNVSCNYSFGYWPPHSQFPLP